MDHQHTLQLNDSETLEIFTCSGCKELGVGTSYICENRNCSYIVHEECAEPVKHAVHPFFRNCNFEFHEKAATGGFCDACGKDLLGFFYGCSKTGDALHPCCLNLQDISNHKDGSVIIKLSHKVTSDCVKCNKRHVVRNQFEGWSYVFDPHSDGKSCVHVSCFKDAVLKKLQNRSNGRTRSFMKFTGKLAFGIFQASLGDFSSIFTIGEAVISAISSD